MTPGPFFGYTASWNEKMDESRAFVALIETLQSQLVSLPKKFNIEMSIFAYSRVVLLTTNGRFVELRLRFVRVGEILGRP